MDETADFAAALPEQNERLEQVTTALNQLHQFDPELVEALESARNAGVVHNSGDGEEIRGVEDRNYKGPHLTLTCAEDMLPEHKNHSQPGLLEIQAVSPETSPAENSRPARVSVELRLDDQGNAIRHEVHTGIRHEEGDVIPLKKPSYEPGSHEWDDDDDHRVASAANPWEWDKHTGDPAKIRANVIQIAGQIAESAAQQDETPEPLAA